MNDKSKNNTKQNLAFMSTGGQGRNSESQIDYGQLTTQDNQKQDNKQIIDTNMLIFKTEESEGDLILNTQPSQILQKLDRLNQKQNIIEEELNYNSDDQIDSEIINIDFDYKQPQVQQQQAKQIQKVENTQDQREQDHEEQDQQSYNPQSDNYEFHSNLQSLERIEEEQRQKKRSTLNNNKDQRVSIEIAIDKKKSGVKGIGSSQNKIQEQNQLFNIMPNKSSTVIESQYSDKLFKQNITDKKNIRQVKTEVEDNKQLKINLTNNGISSTFEQKLGDQSSFQDAQQLQSIAKKRRGGSQLTGLMTTQQRRQTFLAAAKIKNFFSRTYTEDGPNILIQLLNSWKFMTNLKRFSSLWRQNTVTSKQLSLIDDSSHFEMDVQGNRRRKRIFGSTFLSKEQLKPNNSGRKRNQQEGLLMKWLLRSLQPIKIINPESQYLYVWDTIHTIFIILNLLIQPIEFVSYTHMEEQYSSYFWKLFPIICFIIFIIHILLNFNTGFYKRGICIEDRKKVMTNYFRKGFGWDLLALLPIIDSLSQFKSGWRIVNVFVICKYITLRSILGKYLELSQLQNNIFIPTFLKLLKVGFLVLFQAHLFACLFLGLANLEKSYNLTEVTWIEHYSSQQQSATEHKLSEQTVFSQYIYAFYWSVTTMTTTGYGDISASNNYEATFTAFSMIIAGGVFAYSFNSIGFIVQDLNKVNQEFQQDMSLISKYLKNINIKRRLQLEVTKYIEYKHRAEAELSIKEEKEVLEKLDPHIRDKVTISAFFQMVKQIPFLNNNFSRKFLRRLALHMKKETYLNDDIIFEENDQYAAYHPNLYTQFNLQQQQQQQQNTYNPQQYQHQMNAQQNYQLLQLIQQQQQQQQLQNNYNNNNQQNIAGSTSLQQPLIPNYQFQQILQNQNPLHIQHPQVNSLQSIPNFAQINTNHTRKLSGSLQAPNLVSNLYNNNINYLNINSPNAIHMNNSTQPPQRISLTQMANAPQNTLFQNLNVGSNPECQNNINQYFGITPGNLYANNWNNNAHDDYQYSQTLQQSQSDISFYIVERGTVQIYTKCYKYINEDETTKPIKDLKKGDLFGELSFINENPRCASARSIGPSSVLSIKKKDFIKLLKEFPSDYEMFCQIHDEITNNKNLDALYIHCFSCLKAGHTALDCNRVHFQPDKEKVILKHNYKDKEQVSRNKEIWRRAQKYKCLINFNDIYTASKKIENLLQNQSQISSQPNQNQQNFTAYYNNHSSNAMPNPSSFNPASNPTQIIRSNKKLLTLKQLQTLQTQIMDQENFVQPSPITHPTANNFAYSFQPINNYPNQPINQQQQSQLVLNTQVGQKSSFHDLQQENETGPIKSPKQQLNFFSSFQSRLRGSNQNEQIIFEDDNETPLEYDNEYFKKKSKIKSPTTVDTNASALNSNPQNNKNKQNLLIKIQNEEPTASLNNNLNSDLNIINRKNIFGERLSNQQSASANPKDSILNQEGLKILENLDRPPQQTRILRSDLAAALGDNDLSASSSNDKEDEENRSDSGVNKITRKRKLKMAKTVELKKLKSFTNESSPRNQKILKKINQIYQNYGITPRKNSQFQKNILLQLQNVFFQNLESQDDGTQDLEEIICGDFSNQELALHQASRKATNTFLNQQSMMSVKKEIIFEFPSLNTDRMKNFESYFTNYNCNTVLERLSLYRSNAYNKRNRLYHIYCRDTIKKGFQNYPLFHMGTPVNKRNPKQISQIENRILNNETKDSTKKPGINQKNPQQQQINKKLSIIESQVTKHNTLARSNMLSSNTQYRIRSATLFQDDSDYE